MQSLQYQTNEATRDNRKWIRGKLGYINEAFQTDFSTPDQALSYVLTYENDEALLKDMLFDTFVELHEKGDACVIIDRFVVFDRIFYENNTANKTIPEYSCHCIYDSSVAAAY